MPEKGHLSPTNPCRTLEQGVFLLLMEKTQPKGSRCQKSRGLKDAGLALLFLSQFYFYNATLENLGSFSDLMLSHLSTTPGAHWVSMALINGNSSRQRLSQGQGAEQTTPFFPGSWASSPAQHPHHEAEEWKGNTTEQNTEDILDRTGMEGVGTVHKHCLYSWRKLQWKPSGLLGIIIFDLCVCVGSGLCSLSESY